MTVYVDHAATTPLAPEALEAMLPCFTQGYGNPSSLHAVGRRASRLLKQSRETIAQLLGAEPSELVFTSGGSEANNQALFSAAARGAAEGKRHIISTEIEHHAVLNALAQLQKQGFSITLLPPPPNGVYTAQQVRQALRPDTALVSVMAANNEIGALQPVGEIGSLCRQAGVLFHTDAVQAVGQVDLNVNRDQIDLLSLSAHKFYGPKGVGVLYARRGSALQPMIFGGGQERGRRAGTENVPGVVGMAAALQRAEQRRAATAAALLPLRDRLLQELSKLPHTLINGDGQKRLPGNVNLCFEGIEGEQLVLYLSAKSICASSGPACSAGSLEPSHVLLALGYPRELAYASLRLSLGAENTQEEVEYLLREIPAAVEALRAQSPLWQAKISGKQPFLTAE